MMSDYESVEFIAILLYSFPAHFRHLFIQCLQILFSISSRTLRKFVSISSLVDQFGNIVIQFRALSTVFVKCN